MLEFLLEGFGDLLLDVSLASGLFLRSGVAPLDASFVTVLHHLRAKTIP
jgi:hypothetical protein